MSAPTTFLLDERYRPFVQGLSLRPPIDRRGLASGFVIALAIPFSLVGLAVILMTGYTWITWLSFSISAKQATAVITAKATSNDGEDASYDISYRYTTPDGHVATGQASLRHDTYNAVAEGDQIRIEYLPSSPGSSQLADENHLAIPLFLTAIAVIWNGFIGVVLAAVIRGAQQALRLRKAGQLCPAEITSYATEHEGDNDLVVTVEYHLTAPDGQTIYGRDKGVRNALKDRPAPTCPTPAAALYADAHTHKLL